MESDHGHRTCGLWYELLKILWVLESIAGVDIALQIWKGPIDLFWDLWSKSASYWDDQCEWTRCHLLKLNQGCRCPCPVLPATGEGASTSISSWRVLSGPREGFTAFESHLLGYWHEWIVCQTLGYGRNKALLYVPKLATGEERHEWGEYETLDWWLECWGPGAWYELLGVHGDANVCLPQAWFVWGVCIC